MKWQNLKDKYNPVKKKTINLFSQYINDSHIFIRTLKDLLICVCVCVSLFVFIYILIDLLHHFGNFRNVSFLKIIYQTDMNWNLFLAWPPFGTIYMKLYKLNESMWKSLPPPHVTSPRPNYLDQFFIFPFFFILIFK